MNTPSRFAEEIKLTRSFRSSAHEASIAIMRTASCVRNGLERIAREQGISLSQFNILRILRGAGSPLPTMEIANRMVEIEPGVTRLLTKLVQKGLVQRRRHRADARSVLCSITQEGRAVLDQLDASIAQFEENYLGLLNDSELRALIASLANLCVTRA